jgi:hypothetical protein
MGIVRVGCSSAHAKGDAHDQQASSCFRVGLTRLVNEQDIRTPQHIKNRARNNPGMLATDMKAVACVANCRERHAYSCNPDMVHRDRTAWLGM